MLKLILFLISIVNAQIVLAEIKNNYLELNVITPIFNESLSVKFFNFTTKDLNLIKLNLNNSENDELCLKELTAIQVGIFSGQLWAYKIVDSWGKIPSGILMGRLTDYGNFEECMGFSEIINQETNHLLETKYCLANIPLNDLLNGTEKKINFNHIILPEMESILRAGEISTTLPTLRIGICIPKSCQSALVDDKLRELLKSLGITLDKEKSIISPESCQSKLTSQFTTPDIIAISIFSFIGFLMLFSSTYDYTMCWYNKKPVQILTAFSIFSNSRKLFKIQSDSKSNPNIIECLNGIRCLSIIWVVFGHQYSAYLSMVSSINTIEMYESFRTPFMLMLYMGTLSVDSFFLLSGCLVTWVAFKTMEKSNGRLNIFKMYLHRYLRLTPLLAAMVLFTATLQKYFANGPLWGHLPLDGNCNENWWSTLIYVSNYVNPDTQCIGVAWYLCVDTQLFILSPLILWPLWKWGKVGFLPIIIAIQVSMGYVFAAWMYREYHYLPLEMNENDLTRQNYTYFATHARVSPYLIGIVLGYYLYQNRNRKLKLSKLKIIIGWLCSLTIISTLLFGLYHRASKQPESGMTIIEGAIFEPFSRCLWAFALFWVIFACHHGFGGLANQILTFGIWQPLGRLTYGIYIIHITIQMLWYGNFKIEQHFSNIYIIFMFWACFGVTICISVIAALAFESPIIVIENWIFGNPKHEKMNLNKDIESKSIVDNVDLDDNNRNKTSGTETTHF